MEEKKKRGRPKKIKLEEEEIKQEKEPKIRKGKGGRKKLWCEACQELVLDEKGKCTRCGSDNYEKGHELGKGDLFEK